MDRKILGEAKYIRQSGPGTRIYYQPMVSNNDLTRSNSAIFKYLKDNSGGMLRIHTDPALTMQNETEKPIKNKIEPLVQLNFFDNKKGISKDFEDNDKDLSPMSRISKRFYSKYMVNPQTTTMSIRAQKMR